MARLPQIAKRVLIGVALGLAVLYAGDYLSVRARRIHPQPADPFESITTTRLLAIPTKGGKTEYEIDQQNPEQTLTCVHSVFPHYSYSPCWYLKPRANRPIPMIIFPSPRLHFSLRTAAK